MTTIGLVACSKQKLDRPALARDLYTSPLFRAASAYCAATYDRWLILSALHGLVEPDRVLHPYDVTLARMSPSDRRVWAAFLARDLARITQPSDVFYVHAGDRYRHWLMDWSQCPVKVPLAGLGIGQQLRWYKER